MAGDVFDDAQLDAMGRAIVQVMEASKNKSDARRKAVAHAVFTIASETGEFDVSELVRRASEKLEIRV